MQRLSSHLTFFGKFLAPPIWIGGFGWGTLTLFLNPNADFNGVRGGAPSSAKWLSLVIWIAVGIAAIRQARSFKSVHLVDGALLISNYLTEHRIPFSAIVDVRQGRWFNRTVTIELADPNPFNGAVTFVPIGDSTTLPWRNDRIVTHLRRLAGLDPVPPVGRAT